MTEQHYKFQKKQQIIYFHLLSEEDAKEDLVLSNTVFQKKYLTNIKNEFNTNLNPAIEITSTFVEKNDLCFAC